MLVTRFAAVSGPTSCVGDSASGQRIDCCELSNGSSISDVDVNGAGDMGAGVGDSCWQSQ